MGDAPARTELKVTTGPIRGSRKIHVGDLKVAMRAVDLEPSSGEPPVVLYDTSGPYSDPNARIDIMAGLPELRRDWIRARGAVDTQMHSARRGMVTPEMEYVAYRENLGRENLGREQALAATRDGESFGA